MSGRGAGVGVGRTSAVHITEAAKKNAPPPPPALTGCAGVLAMLVVMAIGIPMVNSIGSFLFVVILATVACIAAALFVSKKLKPLSDAQAVAYSRQWYCMTCGAKFIQRN